MDGCIATTHAVVLVHHTQYCNRYTGPAPYTYSIHSSTGRYTCPRVVDRVVASGYGTMGIQYLDPIPSTYETLMYVLVRGIALTTEMYYTEHSPTVLLSP